MEEEEKLMDNDDDEEPFGDDEMDNMDFEPEDELEDN